MEEIEDFISQWRDRSPYIVAHTSGSTGTPKEIRLLKEDMRMSARATNAFFGIGHDSLLALPLSVGYIAGKMMVVRALEAGCRLLPLPVSNHIDLDGLPGPVDLLPVVPSQVDSLVAVSGLRDRVRNVLAGGAALSDSRAAALASTGVKAYIGYGMTETCSHVALSEIDGPLDGAPRLYHAMPGISFATDSRGCLEIVAPHFSFGRLTTNDIVELTATDSFRWLGRYDNVINTGGIKLFAEDIERLYAPALGDRDYFVKGEPDDKWGTALVLVVEGRDEEAPEIGRRLDALGLDHVRLPKKIRMLASLPRTANGKIRR